MSADWVQRFFVLVGLVVPTGAHAQPSVRALDPVDTSERAEVLGQWLDAQAVQQRTERRFTGGAVLGVGAAGLGFGMALLIKEPNNELSKGGGVALTAAGAFGAALGIFRLVVESESEKVACRYEAARREGLTETDLARFEGELYAASQHAQRIRRLARWLGFATTVAGVAVLVATPLAGLSRGGRVAGYVSGGLLVIGGGVNFASSFGIPPPIEAWERYRQGKAPDPRRGRLFGIAPTFGKDGVGLALVVETGGRGARVQ